MEKRRNSGLLQRATGPDPENCFKLCPAVDDQGEDLKEHMGLDACPPKVYLGRPQ